jgi:ASCH domain
MYRAMWIDDSIESPPYGSQGYAYPETASQGVIWRFKPNGNGKTYYCEREQLKILRDAPLMKALTLWQPWATAIALGIKQYETRHWFVSYRGELAIHAAKKPITKEIALIFQQSYPDWENLLNLAERDRGCIVAICNLTDCIEMDDSLIAQQPPIELMFGNWQIGRYAWKLEKFQSTQRFVLQSLLQPESQGQLILDRRTLE